MFGITVICRFWSLIFSLITLTIWGAQKNYEELIVSSSPEQLATLHSAKNNLVGGLINPLSGQLSLSELDLNVKGATPINIYRIYIPPFIPSIFPKHKKTQGEWDKFYLAGHLSKTYRGWTFLPHIRLEHYSSNFIRFTDHFGTTLDFTFSENKGTLITKPYALHNASGDLPGGSSDLRNTIVSRNNASNTFTILAPDGTTYIYGNPYTSESKRTFYLLLKEIMPSGKVLKYNYNKNQVVSIEASKFLLVEGDLKDHVFRCDYKSFGSQNHHFRVQTLFLPSGPNDTFSPVYQFHYEPAIAGESSGYTLIKTPDSAQIRYDFSKAMLITSISWLNSCGKTQKKKLFSWTNQHYLSSIEIQDNKGSILHKKTYGYDPFGNPTLETIHGNLTGETSLETYTIKRAFSNDGRHLLLSEAHENGKVIEWTYLPSTNLLTRKLIKGPSGILLREFHEYDDFNNLITTIHDDGSGGGPYDDSGVTQRAIKRYRLKQNPPHLHMPEWCLDYYLDHGTEKLLRKTKFIYDKGGNIREEHIYGSDDRLAYVIYRSFNERGDILSETTPLGNEKTYGYDAKGRSLLEITPSRRLEIKRMYDLQGRLKTKQEQGTQINRVWKYQYDLLDRLKRENDPLGNQTTYLYDPITHQVIQTNLPEVETSPGIVATPQTSATYDPLERPLTKTDANGNTTSYTYNAYGSPLTITYSDGSQEKYTYYKNGELKTHKDPDGLVIEYTRDILGRPLCKQFFSSSGQCIAEETFTYSGYHLLTHKNKEGYTRHFFYDGAGRKIKEVYEGKVIHYTYNPLGFIESITYENGENTLVIHYTRDNVGQILQEEKRSLEGEVLKREKYSYDADGNQITHVRYINNKESIDHFEYDPLSRITLHKDPLGYSTSYHYKDLPIHNQKKIYQKTIIDPLGLTTLQTFNPYGKKSEETTSTPQGDFIQKHQNYYDPAGNLSLREDFVFDHAHFLSKQTIKRNYDKRNRLKTLVRGDPSSTSRETSYTYTPEGKLKTKTDPNGITLHYQYTPLGHLETLTSSNGEMHHTFTYNKEGHLLAATDKNIPLAIQRTVDPHGNVLEESFSTGLAVSKTYDSFDRPLSLELSTIGSLTYEYNPLFLKKVTRVAPQGSSYTHDYPSYDLNGNLLIENNILGSTYHSYDPLGRKIALTSPFLSEGAQYDSCHQLITKTSDGKIHEYTYDPLGQLTSEKTETTLETRSYDSIYNLLSLNKTETEINSLNEMESLGPIECHYDQNGNLILKKHPENTLEFTYDPLNRLTSIKGKDFDETFIYDPLGRSLAKITQRPSSDTEYYLYDGREEIGALTPEGHLKNFKVLGKQTQQGIHEPLALEINQEIFFSILDLHGNISKLIDPSGKLRAHYTYNSFGLEKTNSFPLSPWRYFSKRTDPKTGLVHFGKRIYDPELSRWLTTDPAQFNDSINLYQYALNNPFKYSDPHGESLLGFLTGIGQIIAGGVIMISGVVIEVATYGGYSFAIGFHEAAGLSLMTTGCATAIYHAKDLSWPTKTSHNWNTYRDTQNYTIDPHGNLIYKSKEKEPPYKGDELGTDPTKPPAEGFEWRGKGTPESGKGNWYNSETKESLHPDLNHPLPEKPHWDYSGPEFPKGTRLNIDGTWDYKR